MACLHYQFEAIHPFVDGNGRVGRLLVTLLMADWGLLPEPLLDLSGYIEPRRDEYYARLLGVATDGDWTGWLQFFLGAVRHQAEDVVARTRRLHGLREEYRARLATARSSGLLAVLVDATSPRSRCADQVGDRQRSKVFLAAGVLRAVEGATDVPASLS